MELRHLRYFVAVAEELHFTRAAERLHIGQPPLSQQIQALEAELGAQLFERNKRSVRLTQAGTLFLDDARRILALSEQAAVTARRAQRGEAGELRIGFTFSTPFTPYFATVINRYRQQFPHVTLTLHEMATLHQLEAISGRTMDLGCAPAGNDVSGRHPPHGIAPGPAVPRPARGPRAGAQGQHRDYRHGGRRLRHVPEGCGHGDLSADFPPVQGGRLRAPGGAGSGRSVDHHRPGGGRLRHFRAARLVRPHPHGWRVLPPHRRPAGDDQSVTCTKEEETSPLVAAFVKLAEEAAMEGKA
jgi:DNA-binding transcriptional LysR family regulator